MMRLALYEETLKIKKAKLGLDHPDTILGMNNLAGAYREAGRATTLVFSAKRRSPSENRSSGQITPTR